MGGRRVNSSSGIGLVIPHSYACIGYQPVEIRKRLHSGARPGHKPCMMEGPYLSTVADTIQSAIAPVFLLAGIGAILNVMVGRLARIVDRARDLELLHPRSTGTEHDRH